MATLSQYVVDFLAFFLVVSYIAAIFVNGTTDHAVEFPEWIVAGVLSTAFGMRMNCRHKGGEGGAAP